MRSFGSVDKLALSKSSSTAFTALKQEEGKASQAIPSSVRVKNALRYRSVSTMFLEDR